MDRHEFYRHIHSKAIQPGTDMTDGGYKFNHDEMEEACEIQSRVAATLDSEPPTQIDWQLATWRKKAIRARQRAQNPRVDLWDCLFEACDIIERQAEQIKGYKREHKERENIFAYLNDKQLPCLGGMRLDVIIRDLGRRFEEQAEQLKAKDALLERQSVMLGELQCKLEQALKGD